MGIIKKQAIKGTIYTYIGAILGFITAIILFPRILSTDEIGLINVLIAYSMILSQFGSLGLNSTTTRMFSYFRSVDNKHNGYLFLLVIISLTGFILSSIVIYYMRPFLMDGKDEIEGGALLVKYFLYIIPISFFTIFFNAFDTYNKVLFNAVRGTFLKEVFQRILIIICVVLYSFNIIDFNQFVISYIISVCSPSFIIVILLIKDRQFSLKPDFKLMTKEMKKSLISVSLFGIITSATGIITISIDRIMIEEMVGLSAAGIYATSFFFGTFIALPSRSLLKISSAVISESWKNNDLETINTLYKKTSISQLIIGSLLLVGIWGNIDNIILLMTKDFESGRYVVLFIGLAYLSDMATGAGPHILMNSRKYRMHALFMLIMIVFIIITNLIFIPIYQIVGAAFASFITKLIVNIIRYIYIWKKFNLQPYNYQSLMVLIIAGFTYFVTYFIPHFDSFYIDILIRGSSITLIFSFLVYFFKLSEDINEYINKALALIKIRSK